MCGTESAQGSIGTGKPDDLSFYVRALATLYRSCATALEPENRRLADGMSEAVNQLVLQRLGIRSPWRMERVQYMAANRPGAGAGRAYATDTSPSLVGVRFQLLATAFSILEEDHPGFLRRFNGRLAERLRAAEINLIDHCQVAAEVEPAFRNGRGPSTSLTSVPMGIS